MQVNYDKLWKLMIDKKINKTQLSEKAGITTTGAPCENELNDVLAEYKEYNSINHLWNVAGNIWDYVLESNLVVSKIDVKKQVKVGDMI